MANKVVYYLLIRYVNLYLYIVVTQLKIEL